MEMERRSGATNEIAGPELLTQKGISQVVSGLSGVRIEYVVVSVEEFYEKMRWMGPRVRPFREHPPSGHEIRVD
jgi:hypothetical protein